ncbi:MAG TPA: hypothetical protein DDW24_06045, partial [Blastocatellia bacterium]|nr:hypothetical protein [Blastocatellia bacterium]
IGMINRVVAPSELTSETFALAARLASGPTGSIGRIKQLMNSTFSNNLRQQMDLEADRQLESGRSSDFGEGVAAFFEKRPPVFTGK